jgi:3-hydroxybutyryl-CoA dehydrogenase
MGRGIAQVFAFAGHRVALVDLKPRPPDVAARLLGDARAEIATNLGLLAALEVLTLAQVEAALARIALVDERGADGALAGADAIFEGVVERLEEKRPVLARIGQAARPDALIASTTSTIAVDALQDAVVHPGRFLNAHWLNPAFLIPLVEVSAGPATAPAALDRMLELLRAAGKVPVRCASRPGFIVPRIQAVAMNEAVRMVEEGVASAEDIDRAIRVGFGVRYAIMGLIEFVDWGGGDILYYASRYLSGALGSDRYAAPEVVDRMMRDGHVGLRAGRGFYDFTGVDRDAYQRETLARFVALLRHLDLLPRPPADAV